MYTAENKFGFGTIYNPQDLLIGNNKIYIFNSACLTIQSEVLGWASANYTFITHNPDQANIIIVLGCQVTDLAILNDINTINKFKEQYKDDSTKSFYIGGCLAQRFDIELPEWCDRLDLQVDDYHPITDYNLVEWQLPFWVDTTSTTEEGKFLRESSDVHFNYLRVGKGCHGKCSYCTIRVTRKDAYELELNKLLPQVEHCMGQADEVVVPTCDTLSINQIDWCYEVAVAYNVKFALRNIEPLNAMASKDTLINFAKSGNLYSVHIPVQSTNVNVLRTMHRDPDLTLDVINLCIELKNLGVIIATNLITGVGESKEELQPIYDMFDNVSVNPYWDGKWNVEQAQERLDEFIPFYKVNI